MKILALSDIHLDINTKRKDSAFTDKLIDFLSIQDADTLILTGDIAGRTDIVIEFLEKTDDLHFEMKLFVPGNHDLWVNQNSHDLSFVKYYDIFPEIFDQMNWHYLPNDPLLIENNAILGTTGWYNYSSRNKIWDNKYTLHDYEKKIHPHGSIELMDRHFIKFGLSDMEIADKFNEDLIQDFQYISRRIDPSEIENFIILSHMVPFEPFIPYRGLFKFDYFTAFFGNFDLGEIIKRETHKTQVQSFFGQTHVPRTKIIDNRINAYCVPIGYPREYGINIEVKKLLQNRTKIVQL